MGNYESTGKKVNPGAVKSAPFLSALFMGLGQLTVLKQYIRGAFFALVEAVMLIFTLFQFQTSHFVRNENGAISKETIKTFRFNPKESPVITSLRGLFTLGDKPEDLTIEYVYEDAIDQNIATLAAKDSKFADIKKRLAEVTVPQVELEDQIAALVAEKAGIQDMLEENAAYRASLKADKSLEEQLKALKKYDKMKVEELKAQESSVIVEDDDLLEKIDVLTVQINELNEKSAELWASDDPELNAQAEAIDEEISDLSIELAPLLEKQKASELLAMPFTVALNDKEGKPRIAEIEKEIKVKTAELQKVMKEKAGVISAKNAIAIDDVVLTDAEKAAIDARDAAIAAVSADIKENLKNMTAASKELKKAKKSFGEESAEFIAANNKVNTLKTKQLQLRAEETKLLNSKTAYQQIKAEVGDSLGVKYRDHSIFMMITGLIILIISIIFIVLYVYNIINAKKTSEIILKNGYPTMAQTKKGMEQTAFPAIGIIPLILMISFFTLIPLIFSALVAFTNYSTPNHIPPANLVDWVGFRSFADMFASTGADGGANTWATAFGSIAIWTVIWAVFATFTCFFVGFFFAVILQDKRVSIPRFYRTVFILPYAIPTMLSLFIWANLLNGTFGPINRTLQIIGLMKQGVPWLTNPTMAKVTLILVNIWIGFPYSMILTTSSMTAIPNSLYEAAVIDGATKFKQFTSITFPLVMFQTGPLLIMQFASNINNFGAVFFLTGGGPNLMLGAGQNAVNATITTQAGATDLLISWIYKLTMNSNNYNTASVLSILVFIVLVPFAVFQFTRTKSFKDGEI